MLLSAPGLSMVALVLFVLFASLVAPALFPLQLLDPAWQLRRGGSLINSAAFPLLAWPCFRSTPSSAPTIRY